MTAAISYDPQDLRILAALEEHHFWFRVRRRIIIDALRRWFPNAHDYLEIGSGTGFIARGIRKAFPDWEVLVSDPLAQEPGVQHIHAQRIPYGRAFDVVGAYDVLEHIEDDRSALKEFCRVCRPAGGVLLTVPQHKWLWSSADENAQHHRRYRRKELLSALNLCGFELLGCTSFHTLNLPLFLLRNAILGATAYVPRVSAPAPALNWVLGASMEVDRMLIHAGISLPFGTSLLVAARRKD